MTKQNARFPIMYVTGRRGERSPVWVGCPDDLPWSTVESHEEQAMSNHSQTLACLADRGGLSPCELFAVLHDRRWQRAPLPENELAEWIKSLGESREDVQP